jgi:hypothetical protein
MRRRGEGAQDQVVTTDLDALATALYCKIDNALKESPHLALWRPVGITPNLSDAELVTMAVIQALLGFVSEARWLRHARAHLRQLFPYLPKQPGYNKRLRKAAGLIVDINVSWRSTPRCGWTMSGWSIPSRSSADTPAGRSSARNWPDEPSMATAPATPASFGICGCTWCARCTACRSPSLPGAKADEHSSPTITGPLESII